MLTCPGEDLLLRDLSAALNSSRENGSIKDLCAKTCEPGYKMEVKSNENQNNHIFYITNIKYKTNFLLSSEKTGDPFCMISYSQSSLDCLPLLSWLIKL